MSADLIAFIEARLAEDEQIARAAPGPSWEGGDSYLGTDERDLLWGEWSDGFMQNDASVHAARHDPARVLREVEAKRRLLALHRHVRYVNPLDAASKFEEDHRQAFDEPPLYVGCVLCHYDSRHEENYPSWWCDHVQLLAAPYSDHPDYRQEWAP